MAFMGATQDGSEKGPEADAASAARSLHQRLTTLVQLERRTVRELALGLAEMARTRGFVELGYAGLAEYGERAFGLGYGKAGQLVSLGRKLPKLPALDQALADGELGWTKARAVARVATPATEEAWVALALVSTSRELEEAVLHSIPGQPPRDPRDQVDPPRKVHARFVMEMEHFELLMRALEQVRQDLDGVDVSASQLLLELAERELARGTAPDPDSAPHGQRAGHATHAAGGLEDGWHGELVPCRKISPRNNGRIPRLEEGTYGTRTSPSTTGLDG